MSAQDFAPVLPPPFTPADVEAMATMIEHELDAVADAYWLAEWHPALLGAAARVIVLVAGRAAAAERERIVELAESMHVAYCAKKDCLCVISRPEAVPFADLLRGPS